MELIKKQGDYITDIKHLESLYILKKCMENSINKKYRVSIKAYTKKTKFRNVEDVKEDKLILENINYTIEHYIKLCK